MSTVPFLHVLGHELRLIRARRALLRQEPPPDDAGGEHHSPGNPGVDAPPPAIADAQRTSPLGLAFSGGGIRSATFNLGVLQGLSECGLLRSVDYLSSVSGGGYIGAWLHGVISRAPGAGRPAAADEQWAHARRVLRRGVHDEPGPLDEDPIAFLRAYSNYLAPRPGLFTADTWTIGFIWLRNVLLNQLILVPAIAAAVAATLLLLLLYQLPLGTYAPALGLDVVAAAMALAGLGAAAMVMTRHLRPIAGRSVAPQHAAEDVAVPRGRGILVVPLAFAGMVALGSGHFDADRMWGPLAVVFAIIMAFVQIAGGFLECYRAREASRTAAGALWNVAWMSVVCGSVAAALVTLAWRGILWSDPWVHLAIGPPLVGACFTVSVMLLIGLMGVDYPDAAREWTARIGSMLAIVFTAWLGLFGLIVYGPWAVAWTVGNFETSGLAGIAAWVLTTAAGVLAGRSGRTSDGAEPGKASRVLAVLTTVAPTVFLIGYIVLIAAGVHALMPGESRLQAPAGIPRDGPATAAVSATVDVAAGGTGAPDGRFQSFRDFEARYPGVLALRESGFALPAIDSDRWTQLDWAAALLVGAILVFVIASRRININEFSLHHFYKNRLVRCYLGASHAGSRRPDALTGFDPSDELRIAGLQAGSPARYAGPYPIVNAALNLNAGSELATQERKAASFVFTPSYCGFDPPTSRATHGDAARGRARSNDFETHGYRPTVGYAFPAGPDIGTAIAISGAAANPNWGYHTSGPMAFLLTVFNARLGWWLGNPRWRDASRRSAPKLALRYLFAELLGMTTGTSRFVNLSDGGHFDNLGLYELVRRRARFIILCDAEEDRHLTFGSLGGAIRKCRADFGVEIDISPDPIRIGPDGRSAAHCVVGSIRYPERETAFAAGLTEGIRTPADGDRSRGWLLYLKASLTGDEPADVAEYRSQHPEFPHQSTGDQFFSESQFESYRRLGYHVVRSAFEGVAVAAALPPLRKATAAAADEMAPDLNERHPLVRTFQALTRKWYAPIPVSGEAASRLAADYVTLFNRLSSTNGLEPLLHELMYGTPAPGGLPSGPLTAAEMAAGVELMQLVQNVYTEFELEHAFNRANPRNAGWMSVFRKWRRSPILYERIWPAIERDYHPLFGRFVRDLTRDEPPPDRP